MFLGSLLVFHFIFDFVLIIFFKQNFDSRPNWDFIDLFIYILFVPLLIIQARHLKDENKADYTCGTVIIDNLWHKQTMFYINTHINNRGLLINPINICILAN